MSDPIQTIHETLDTCETLALVLEKLPEDRQAWQAVISSLTADQGAALHQYLGVTAIMFGQLRERFLIVRHQLEAAVFIPPLSTEAKGET